MYMFLSVLGLCCCPGPSLVAVCGFSSQSLLLLWGMGSRFLGVSSWAHRLSCPAAREIFLDQGGNLRPLHWQVDS